MKRIWAAVALLTAACILLLLGSLAVFFAFNQLENDLTEAQALCAQGRYQRAADLLQDAGETLDRREHLLALFLRRDDLRQLQANLHGLPAYACEEYCTDFFFESRQILAQITAMRHLFFSLL